MILGILSDTHGQHQRTARAVRLLQQAGAGSFVHCGDVGGAAVLEQFAGLPTWLVWGNTDPLDPYLERYARTLGLIPPAAIPTRITIDGCGIAVFHGHESQFSRLLRLIRSGDLPTLRDLACGVTYILYGHTHLASVTQLDNLRIINPGALARAQPHTVATLDLAGDSVCFWDVDRGVALSKPPGTLAPR